MDWKSIFGGGGGSSAYTGQRDSAVKRLTAGRNALQPFLGQAGETRNYASGNYLDSLKKSVDFYRQDPYTDAYSARRLAEARAGATADFAGARSNLAANTAARGIGDSSIAAGGNSAINAAEASASAQARAGLAQSQIGEQERRQQMILQLLGGASGGSLAEILGISGQQMGADQAAAGIYNQAEQADLARQQQEQQMWLGLLSGFGGAVGSYYGARGPVGKQTG